MARALSELYEDIQMLSASEKEELLRTLVAELDGPANPRVEQKWLEESQRRHRELVEGTVQGVPGPVVFDRLRTRLRQ